MRVLLLNQTYWPDVAATAQHAHDLARHLAAHGHEVVVIASRSIYGEKGAALPQRETADGIEIHRVAQSLFGKAGIIARLVDFALFYVAAALKLIFIRRPDVIVCFSTPPYIALLGWMMKLLRRSRYVYWLMDVYPDVLVAHGLLKRKSPATRALEIVSRFALKRADRVVVLGRCMERRVMDKGIDPRRIAHIGVWADHDEVKPVAKRGNVYRKQWKLDDRFVVMYSGNFGLVHDVDTMCHAAANLNGSSNVSFVFVGGGKRKAEVQDFVSRMGISARVESYQPRENLDALLSCADIHLVSLRCGYEGLVVPSKLYGIMAAGRPTIFIGPPGSEIARAIVEHDCGVVVKPGDGEQLVKAIRLLAEDSARCKQMGRNARAALKQKYDRRHACEAWRTLLEELHSP